MGNKLSMNKSNSSCLCFFVFVMSVLFLKSATSQTQGVFIPELQTIHSKLLIGVWGNIDSSERNIEFFDSRSNIIMKSNNHLSYYFSKDSTDNVLVSGYHPNWPPFECLLSLISIDTLSVSFTQLGVPEINELFIKK
jgi:hypothetical protein